MNSSEAYEQLSAHSKEAAYLGSAIGLLHWDQRTQIPPEGHAHRVNVLSYLAKVRHQMVTDPRIGEWLADLEGSDTDRQSVVGISREHSRMAKIVRSRDQDLGKACGRDREGHGRGAVSLGKGTALERLEYLRAVPGANCFA